MAEKGRPREARAARLLLKAIRGLPDREQQVVLGYLVERAFEPSERMPRGAFGPSFVTPALVKEVGRVAARMLRSAEGVAGIARLYGLPEEAVRAALHEVASNPESRQPLASVLGLLAEGHSQAEAVRELGISKDQAIKALEGLAAPPLDGRLGQALFAHGRIQAQASAALSSALTLSTAPPEKASARLAEGLAARVIRMLIADCDVRQIPEVYDLPEDAVRGALREVAEHPDASEPLASVLRLVADGRDRAEVAAELGISEQDVTTALEELLPTRLERRLKHALEALVAVRSVDAPSSPSLAAGVRVAGGLQGGQQQMVPVRFPEPQYRRLKEWCGQHGFSMAVVVRGLVERFLDDQDRRAA